MFRIRLSTFVLLNVLLTLLHIIYIFNTLVLFKTSVVTTPVCSLDCDLLLLPLGGGVPWKPPLTVGLSVNICVPVYH